MPRETRESLRVTLMMLREWRHDVEGIRQRIGAELGDPAIDRGLREILTRLGKYVERAALSKTRALTAGEIEAAINEELT